MTCTVYLENLLAQRKYPDFSIPFFVSEMEHLKSKIISNFIPADTLKPLLLGKINIQLYLQLKRVLLVDLKCPMLCEGISGYIDQPRL